MPKNGLKLPSTYSSCSINTHVSTDISSLLIDFNFQHPNRSWSRRARRPSMASLGHCLAA